jgi:hypothetical protein
MLERKRIYRKALGYLGKGTIVFCMTAIISQGLIGLSVAKEVIKPEKGVGLSMRRGGIYVMNDTYALVSEWSSESFITTIDRETLKAFTKRWVADKAYPLDSGQKRLIYATPISGNTSISLIDENYHILSEWIIPTEAQRIYPADGYFIVTSNQGRNPGAWYVDINNVTPIMLPSAGNQCEYITNGEYILESGYNKLSLYKRGILLWRVDLKGVGIGDMALTGNGHVLAVSNNDDNGKIILTANYVDPNGNIRKLCELPAERLAISISPNAEYAFVGIGHAIQVFNLKGSNLLWQGNLPEDVKFLASAVDDNGRSVVWSTRSEVVNGQWVSDEAHLRAWNVKGEQTVVTNVFPHGVPKSEPSMILSGQKIDIFSSDGIYRYIWSVEE